MWVLDSVSNLENINMNFKYYLLLIAWLFFVKIAYTQNSSSSIEPFIKTGYGYFSDGFMIDGNVLFTEIGIKQSNGYFFSFNFKMGETLNDRGFFPGFDYNKYEFIYSYKIASLFMGYDFKTKNQKHSFLPKIGLFITTENNIHPSYDLDSSPIIIHQKESYIGAAVELGYQYYIFPNIAVGLNSSGYLGYNIGFMYFTFSPTFSFKL